MPNSRKVSPARSQAVKSPLARPARRSRSVCSANSNTSLRLTTIISDSFKLTPIANRQSVLNDDTDIEIPGRKSWWKKLGENSRDVMDVLENRDIAEVNNVAEEFDVEILSQEKKNYSMDLPESSDGESINSIVIPQRKLFTQKENQVHKKFRHIIDNRETLAKLQKSHIDVVKEIKVVPKNLFNQAPRPRTKPAFPAALLNISSKAVNKTKEMPPAEVQGQVRNLFGNRPGVKRKNMFADFIVSESEDEIPDIQPKVFGFQKNKGQKRRESSASRGGGYSPTSSIDLEMDEWKLLPSSTMVENLLEEAGTTPVKRAKLSKLSEAKESDTTNVNSTVNKTKHSNKSMTSKNKSKNSSKLKENNKSLNLASQINNHSLDNSNNVTRNKSKSIRESASNDKHHSKISNKSKNALKSIQSISGKGLIHEGGNNSKQDIENNIESNLKELQNISTEPVPGVDDDDDDEDFTLEYENDDEQINHPTNSNVTDNVNKKDTNNQLIKDTDVKNTTSKGGFDDGLRKTTTDKDGRKEKSKTANDTDEQENADTHVEEQVQPTKQQNLSFKKNCEQKENQTFSDTRNNSRLCEIVNIDDDCHQRTKTNSEKIENTDSKPLEKSEYPTIEKEGEGKGKSKHTNKTQNDSKQQELIEKTMKVEQDVKTNRRLINEQTDKSVQEEFIEAEDEIDTNQTLNDKHDESDDDEKEVETNQIINDEQEENEENEESNEAEEEKETNQKLDDEQNKSNEAEVSMAAEEEVETKETLNDEQNESNEAEESMETEDEVEPNQTVDDEQNESDEDEEEVEANQTQDDEQNESDEDEEEVETNQTINDEQEESDETEKSSEADEEVETNQTLDEEQNESDEPKDEVDESEEKSDSDINQNETEEQHMGEIETLEEENESETEEQQESETRKESDNDESDDNLQNESNLSQNEKTQEEDEIESEQEQSEIVEDVVTVNDNVPDEPDDHDTTGRYRKKNVTVVKSPEAILHDKISEMESFTVKGRNTSIRKTKSISKHLNIRPSLAPVRESTGISDGTRDSSAEGSGWDSHRTTRKTIRLTMGKDFTPRKSLRALVMEKSAKRNTNFNAVELADTQLADNTKIPQGNSTELPAFDSYQETEPMHVDETAEEPSDHEISARTKQTTLEMYLHKIKQENIQRKRKMEEEVRASLKVPTRDSFNSFKMPLIPVKRMKPAQNKLKPKQIKSSLIPLNILPPEVLEDMKYKPPKRFQPSNASWITKRLYKFLENKLEPKYDYKARVRAERLVELLYAFTREVRRGPSEQAVDTLKKEMARLDVVKTHFEFYNFFHEFMPREIRVKVVPDVVNKISLPKHGVFSDIMQ